MALVYADRVTDTTTGTGTGPFTVAGVAMFNSNDGGFQPLNAVCSVADTFYGAMWSLASNQWVTGLFTYSAANQVTITSIDDSSNGGLAVNFGSGTKVISIAPIADRLVVTDHGMLVGLGDDDHTQYHNNARGDARYTPIAHVSDLDPHTQYHTDARGDARYTPIAPSLLGINATADTTNRLAVAALASLFNHVGNGHQVKVNKNAAGDTASFLFQTGFSARAEFGTTGDDDFHFKVSPDGSTFYEAMIIDRTTGKVAMPATQRVTTQVFTSSGTWTKPAGCTSVRVRCVGAGGGGAGATAASSQCCAGGGGAAGALAEGIFDVTSTSSVTVTIGAGGAGGAAANTNGSAGGGSSFGALLTAPTGPGGGAMSSGTTLAVARGGPASGASTGGAVAARGSSGGNSFRMDGTVFITGFGGVSVFGGAPRGTNLVGIGEAGGSPGAGGAGAGSNSATGYAGGAGASGIVIVEEFY